MLNRIQIALYNRRSKKYVVKPEECGNLQNKNAAIFDLVTITCEHTSLEREQRLHKRRMWFGSRANSTDAFFALSLHIFNITGLHNFVFKLVCIEARFHNF